MNSDSIRKEDEELYFLYVCSISREGDAPNKFFILVILILINHAGFNNRVYLIITKNLIHVCHCAIGLYA